MLFVPINCAAIPETLLESEIFGHEKGAFTGAFERRARLFRAGRSGNALPDDSRDDTHYTGEAAGVLQERASAGSEAGSSSPWTCGSLLPPTSIPLTRWRRVNSRGSLLPAERVRDLAANAAGAARGSATAGPGVPERVQRADNRSVLAVSQEAMRILEDYQWPGNVRELRNVIERATISERRGAHRPRHLPPMLVDTPQASQASLAIAPGTTVEEAERRLSS